MKIIHFFFKKITFFTLLICITYVCKGQTEFPHILVKNSEKEDILKKINHFHWAKSIFDEIYAKVTPYVERHKSDPEWILGRYLMNRVEGRRYTHAYDNGNGHYIVKFSGDAPVPTVRVSTHKRNPVTNNGFSYVMPSIEELVPNDTSSYIWTLNKETGKKDFIDPQQFISIINGEINELALNAAVIYWLYGDESYARFAADILNQWANGVYYQEPVVGACRTGFLDIQTLGDNRYQSLILAYDFLYPFLKKEGYELSWYQSIFEKFASVLTFRGYWNNNWYAAVSSTQVYAILSLEDKGKQDYYLQFVFEKDTINGACGHLSFQSTVDKWLTHDGHWKEPGGYHNFPVLNFVKAAIALEKNGHPVFQKYPELLDATYVMLKYSFPNLYVSAFGDTGRASQSPALLEAGLVIASKYDRAELSEMMSSLNTLINDGKYERDKSGIFGLLTFLPEFPEIEVKPYLWPRSGELDFASFFYQRNGTDKEHGLMYGVQGASYNHNHCNGMSMELYGCGEIMGIDAGTGPNYEHPLHQYYFSQWAAHNTVVAAGKSSSVPFSGAAGEKNIGKVELAAMEPMPEEKAVSPLYSFTDTRYFDISTGTNQLRTMAIIRVSDTTGYYIDIYRSDNDISNDYVYHNIGDSFTFYDYDLNPVKTETATYPMTENDYPGFRFYSEVHKIENFKENIKGLFSARNRNDERIFMHVFLPGSDKIYFSAKSLPVKTAGPRYIDKPLPLFTMRTEKEAWTEPFISVFEPSFNEIDNVIEHVKKNSELCDENNIVLHIVNKNGSEQIILQGNSSETIVKGENFSFSGHFGVISIDNKGNLQNLYLGEGNHIIYNDVEISAIESISSASLSIDDNSEYSISSTQPVRINLRGTIINTLK